MSEYKYSYTIDQFPNNEYDISKLDRDIRDSSIAVSLVHLAGYEEYIDIFFRNVLSSKDWSTLSGIIDIHDGEPLPEDTVTPVEVTNTTLPTTANMDAYLTHYSSRLKVHQTSKKPGLSINWTSKGDNRATPTTYGTGNAAQLHHKVGDPMQTVVYLDFNMTNNETWIHELILTWKDCMMDEVTSEIVTDYTPFVAASGTSYSTYGSFVMPAAPGTGNVTPTGDFTTYSGGLVRMPPSSDSGESFFPSFWDTTWSHAQGSFINVAPNLYGMGGYNLFHEEASLYKVLNSITLLGSGFQILNSSDTEQLGHGMRIKVTFTTVGDDHEWACSAILVMHREQIVI